MSENQNKGGAAQSGAASALGAHSKDGATGSGTSGSGNMGSSSHGGSQNADRSTWQSASGLADQARDGMEKVRSTVRDAAETARDTISTRGGQAVEQTSQMVREQPLIALAVTGIACLAIGMMIGRGSRY